jgi:tRNA modification GTPase
MVDEISESPEVINTRADLIRAMITGSEKRLIVVVNKIDLGDPDRINELKHKIYLDIDDSLVFISAREHSGLDKLKGRLGKVLEKEKLAQDELIITNIRHYEALVKVSESLARVRQGLSESIPEDLVAIDIRQAIHYLGEITGEITSDEILGNIFKNFCIGK